MKSLHITFHDQIPSVLLRIFITELNHLLEFPFRVDVHQWEWHFTRIKRFFSQAYHHRRILSDTVKHHRILKFRRHLADDMNRLGFEFLQVA